MIVNPADNSPGSSLCSQDLCQDRMKVRHTHRGCHLLLCVCVCVCVLGELSADEETGTGGS